MTIPTASTPGVVTGTVEQAGPRRLTASAGNLAVPRGAGKLAVSPWTVTARSVANYVLLGIPLALISDLPDSTSPLLFITAKAFLYLLLMLGLTRSVQQSLLLLLLFAVIGQDITQTSDEQELGESFMASIWQGQLGILRPSWVFMAYYLIVFVRAGVSAIDRPVSRALLFFSTVPVLTGWLYGAWDSGDAGLEIPADAKLPLFLLTTVFLARNEVRLDPAFAGKLLSAFLGSILARHAVDLAYFVLGMAAKWGDVQRVSVDSTKGTVVLIFLLSQFLIFRRSQFGLGMFAAVTGGTLLLVFTTRGLWLSAALGVLLTCCMMRAGKVLSTFVVTGAVAAGVLYGVALFKPENLELAMKRFHSKTVHGSDNFFENQDPARYYQSLNAWDATQGRGAFLWGSGYGSYYTESAERFPAEVKIESAFPQHSLRSGQFYTLHHFVLKMLFKYGLVGFGLLAWLWIQPGWQCFQMVRQDQCQAPYDLLISLVAFLPTSMLEISWTTKGMAVSGFLIAICMSAAESYRRLQRQRSSPAAALRRRVQSVAHQQAA